MCSLVMKQNMMDLIYVYYKILNKSHKMLADSTSHIKINITFTGLRLNSQHFLVSLDQVFYFLMTINNLF